MLSKLLHYWHKYEVGFFFKFIYIHTYTKYNYKWFFKKSKYAGKSTLSVGATKSPMPSRPVSKAPSLAVTPARVLSPTAVSPPSGTLSASPRHPAQHIPAVTPRSSPVTSPLGPTPVTSPKAAAKPGSAVTSPKVIKRLAFVVRHSFWQTSSVATHILKTNKHRTRYLYKIFDSYQSETFNYTNCQKIIFGTT